MSQFGHYSTTVQDSAGNAISGASVTIYREGATLSSSQSGTSPKTFTVADHGSISTGDTVFINTTTGTTYAVDAATTTTITLSGFAGTLALNAGDRIVPSNSKPTIYTDDTGVTAASNPLTTTALGFAECWIALAANDTPQDFDVLMSGSGVTSQLRREQAWPSPPTLGNIRWAHQYDSATSETGGIQEAINSIGDASATNPYTVMLRPGVYTVDRGKDAGTQTGTADFVANGVTVTGTGTKFNSTQALTGTVTMATNVEAVTGSGTLFLTELQAGDYIQLNTDGATDFGRVKTIESNTALTLEMVGAATYPGPGGSGAARFREIRIGDHIKAGADPVSAYTRVTAIASDVSLTVDGRELIPNIPGTTGYLGTTLNGATITKKTFYQMSIDMKGLGVTGGEFIPAKDYISLVGMDRDTCIILRNKAAGSLTGVIQGCAHSNFANFTVYCNGTRNFHWDEFGYLIADNIRLKSEAATSNSAGFSTGIVSTTSVSSYHRISNCHFDGTIYSCHSNAEPVSSLENYIWLTGNTFTNTGTVIGFDLSTAGANSLYNIFISGSVQRYFNVDPGFGAVDLLMPTTLSRQPNVRILTDGNLRFGNSSGASIVLTNDTADYFFNAVIYPQELTGYVDDSGVTSGDVEVFLPATGHLATTTTANAQWPVVACNQTNNAATATWSPRLCTGRFGACFVQSAQVVAPGDTLVTSTTAKDAFVNNAQTDLTRIIGWAFNGKTAGARRLVIFRRNMTLAW